MIGIETWKSCVEGLYEAVGEEESLARALGRFRPHFRASGVTFLTAPHGGASRSIHIAACDVSPASLVEYHSHYFVHDEWVRAAWDRGGMKAGAVYRGTDLVPHDRLRRTNFWRDFLSRFGVIDILCAVLQEADLDQPAAFVTFHRTVEQPLYEAEHVEAMRQLVPHLSRVLRLHQRLTPRITIGTTLARLFDAAKMPLLFVDKGGELLEGNPAASKLLASRDASIRLVGKQLNFLQQRWTPFSTLVQRLGETPQATLDAELWNSRGNPTSTMKVRAVHSAFSERHRDAMLCTVVPALHEPDLAMRRFGFTRAEQSIAIQLTQGLSVHAIATAANVSESTVRTHLRSIFGKTGTSRQATLVAVLLGADPSGPRK